MTDDYKTMRVPESDWKAAKEQKEELGLTWGEWINPDVEGNATTEKDFEDYFTPDVAQTIAQHVIAGMDGTGPVQLEATEYRKIADAVTESLR